MDEKKIDETWKNKVEGEQNKPDKQEEHQEVYPVDFGLFISSLGMQALISLGELENPITNKKEINLPQGKYLIDTIEMLQQKTKGNLSDEEGKMLEQILYELRMKYVTLSNK